MLYDPRKSNVSKIERESGVKFEHISVPQQANIAKAAVGEAVEMITQVSDNAEELLKTFGLSAVELLAKALAKAALYRNKKNHFTLFDSIPVPEILKYGIWFQYWNRPEPVLESLYWNCAGNFR
ncbi:DEAD-box ATP-dependent RNA helicase 7 [Morella rubra]|uniref:DEAD-box ATP-dependent RNA helicase 7 n=1 Tax=Morella rubra TaxID=262757 RepID=A0A6A1WGX9_9ROSI|nr:DEAD-box ATP-dependent RNA helicase 7 [Morella rubra]